MPKNKLLMIVHAVVGLLCLTCFIASLVFYIQSYSVWDDDGAATDYSFDKEMLIFMIVSAIIFGYCVYFILSKNISPYLPYYIAMAVSTIGAAYCFSVFFKAIAKGKEFSTVQNYFIIGLVILVLDISAFVLYLFMRRYRFKNSKED